MLSLRVLGHKKKKKVRFRTFSNKKSIVFKTLNLLLLKKCAEFRVIFFKVSEKKFYLLGPKLEDNLWNITKRLLISLRKKQEKRIHQVPSHANGSGTNEYSSGCHNKSEQVPNVMLIQF